ncbi:MAG: FAD-dependent oxidoreductase [Actinomycetota bacterium]|nr:FAD-dependent oxidoreductase [Actinomycetota bacterium]
MVDHQPPRRALVVGAGMVGLSVAWFLQDAGVEVTVLERHHPAAGASWGNAGWVSPGLAVPLPEPAVLRYGMRALLDPTGALYVPPTLDPGLWAFLLRFARNCTARRWREAMSGYLEINSGALEAFDVLAAGGVVAETIRAPILAGFTDRDQAAGMRHELELMARAGQPVEADELDGDAARKLLPQLSWRVGHAICLGGQRYLDPGAFASALAESVRDRGGAIQTGYEVAAVRRSAGGKVRASAPGLDPVDADVAVLASGTWIGRLAAPFGVRVPVRAGRGYSFGVPTSAPVPCPAYFPVQRVACTPYRGQLRVGGTMELGDAASPANPTRIDALIASAEPLLSGVHWQAVHDTWVGSRPITPDGLALIGATTDPAVHVAGGHGMWGITLGPVTGRLLADQIVTGRRRSALAAFDPLR